MKVAPEVRSLVHFVRINLNDEQYPRLIGQFDLIFCRNVFIYFDAAGKTRAINRVLDRLAPDGVLFLGRSESLHGISDRVRGLEPAVYALAVGKPLGSPTASRKDGK
jgi:chemotaxis protein methyltransferase CheR